MEDGGLSELDMLLTELNVNSHPPEPAPMPEYDTVDSLMADLTMGRIETNQPHVSAVPVKEKAAAPVKTQAVAPSGGASARSNTNDDLDAILGNMNFDEDADVSVAFCQQCRGAIGSKEKQLTAFGKKYHTNHFYCNGCKSQMGFGAFYEKDGCAYCDNCFGTILTFKCNTCLSPIVSGEYMRVGENRYHPHCFKCVVCRREIDHYYLVGNQYYCDKDYILKCAPKCDECHNPIPNKFISAMGRQHHPDCFICQQCRSPIRDRFFNVGGRPLCHTCDPRKLVVSHPQHERPRLQAATVVTAATTTAPVNTYSTKVQKQHEPLSPRSDEFAARRVNLAVAGGGSNRRAPVLDADSMRTARKARTAEMKRRATEVATERQAAWKSMQPKPWKESPARGNDMLATLPGYHLENGVNGPAIGQIDLRVERDTSLYKETMLDVDHDTFVAVNDPDDNPVIVSVDDDAVKEDGKKLYRAIVRTGKADTRVLVACEKKKDRLKALREVLEEQKLATSDAKFKQVKKAEICNDLVEFDVKNFKNRFKFGMLYALPDQSDEKKMFSNPEGSPAFYTFLDNIAKRHQVSDWKEWTSYNGGLNNQTGKNFYYTTFQEAEIMLHVSTLLPYNASDPQQLERKRHLGNDVLMIVFRDGPGVQLSPTMFNSHFNHVFAVVEPSGPSSYHVNFSSKTGVKTHNPPLPLGGIIPASQLRDWFLCKGAHFDSCILSHSVAINAESKAMQSPDFSHALLRTRKQMLGDIIKKYSS